KEELAILLQKGFVRVIYNGSMQKIESLLEDAAVENPTAKAGDLLIVIDRITVDGEEDTANRVADSVQTAFFEGKGDCYVEESGSTHTFSDRFALDGITVEEPIPTFSGSTTPMGLGGDAKGTEGASGLNRVWWGPAKADPASKAP